MRSPLIESISRGITWDYSNHSTDIDGDSNWKHRYSSALRTDASYQSVLYHEISIFRTIIFFFIVKLTLLSTLKIQGTFFISINALQRTGKFRIS